jgi:hypothetical protein
LRSFTGSPEKDIRERIDLIKEKARLPGRAEILGSGLSTTRYPCRAAASSSRSRDAALYITKLPKAEHDTEPWAAAMEALRLVAELGGPTMFARIGVMRALNRHVERAINPDRKDAHWGRSKLARDR